MLDGSSGSVTATLMYDHVYKVCASYSGRGSNNERKSCLEHYCTEQFAVDFTAQMNVRCATVIDRFARQMETKPEENLVNILQEVQTSLGAQVDLTEGEQYPENTAEIVHHINMVKEAHAFAVFAFDAHTT
ncbi:hypothetical protein N7456_003156 [Penicillium angulare]|uniref:Uncharacterized protein n=1 Tax=Penicillium angulare TaxID=116970 RepID=A0A9W9FU37_9EURO|nr:hypothetical protein N7456_003156 [Penicillium angulare]